MIKLVTYNKIWNLIDTFPHFPQQWRLLFMWFCSWILNAFRKPNVLPQYVQWYGRSLVCTTWCSSRLDLFLKVLLHVLHINSFNMGLFSSRFETWSFASLGSMFLLFVFLDYGGWLLWHKSLCFFRWWDCRKPCNERNK